jgi:hypothetical protein
MLRHESYATYGDEFVLRFSVDYEAHVDASVVVQDELAERSVV